MNSNLTGEGNHNGGQPNPKYTLWQDIANNVNYSESDEKLTLDAETRTERSEQKSLENDREVSPANILMERWSNGFNPITRSPWPFECDLDESFYNEFDLKTILEDKTSEEAEEIVKKNNEILFRNNEEIKKLNNRILQIYEMTPEEKEALYNDEKTSSSDKSLIACVEFWTMPGEDRSKVATENRGLLLGIAGATNSLYGFDVIIARQNLKEGGSHFNILTQKEREAAGDGSLEDIASAALESYLMNPNYNGVASIKEYDDFLYGMMLDCTKREVAVEKSGKMIRESVDLDEFQSRVVESMSLAFLERPNDKIYEGSEARNILLKVLPKERADVSSGHHFPANNLGHSPNVSIKKESDSYTIPLNTKDSKKYWKTFERQIQRNNEEVFKYNKELAKAEMEPWADKLDLNMIEAINNGEMPIEEKIKNIMSYIQEMFEIRNLDDQGEVQPIGLRWFYYKTPKLIASIKRLFGKTMTEEEKQSMSEGSFLDDGYYSFSNRSVLLPVALKKKAKLSSFEIRTIVHEMWHAKQHDVVEEQRRMNPSFIDDAKARLYDKNDRGYIIASLLSLSKTIGYISQVKEREAFAIGDMIERRMRSRYFKNLGKRILDAVGAKL